MTTQDSTQNSTHPYGETIHISGLVQGVGFRPTVWHLATEIGLIGEVFNTSQGVQIKAWGNKTSLDCFIERLQSEAPPPGKDYFHSTRSSQPFTHTTRFSGQQKSSGHYYDRHCS